MTTRITKAEVNRLTERLSRSDAALKRLRSQAQKNLQTVKERTQSVMEEGIQSLEVGSTAFGLGFINGRYGGIEIMGVPLDLGLGIVARGASFIGLMGSAKTENRYWKDLGNVGDGALASYLAFLGGGIGERKRREANQGASASQGAQSSGMSLGGSVMGGSIQGSQPDREMAQVVRQAAQA